MSALNRSSYSDPLSPSTLPPVGVLQIGDGNFLRAFADWMIDVANEAGLLNAHIVIAPPRSAGIVERLNGQDGLFTVLVRGIQNGAPVNTRRIVRCVTGGVNPRHNPEALLTHARNPQTRFVISNTTEAGITYVEQPHHPNEWPRSFPAQAAVLLWERFQTLGGGPKTGLIFLPTELIEANGATLRDIVLRHASDWTLPQAFSDWVQARQSFPEYAGGSHRPRLSGN